MAEKKRRETERNAGRAKAVPEKLDARYQIRCASADIPAWEDRAKLLGHRGASAWIRKTLNDALKQPVR
jgi:hypothetical protein